MAEAVERNGGGGVASSTDWPGGREDRMDGWMDECRLVDVTNRSDAKREKVKKKFSKNPQNSVVIRRK